MSDKKKFTVHTGGNAAQAAAPDLSKAFAEVFHIMELEKTATQIRFLAYEKLLCKHLGITTKDFNTELGDAIADVEDGMAGLIQTPHPIEIGDFVRLEIRTEGEPPKKGLIPGVGDSNNYQSHLYQFLEKEILGKRVGDVVTLADKQGKVVDVEIVRVSRH